MQHKRGVRAHAPWCAPPRLARTVEAASEVLYARGPDGAWGA